jgi:PAS domain S-box-containing protein
MTLPPDTPRAVTLRIGARHLVVLGVAFAVFVGVAGLPREDVDGAEAAHYRLLVLVFVALFTYLASTLVRIGLQSASVERTAVERTRELEASREQYRTLVETMSAVPWRWDDDRRVFTYVGPQAGELLGCAPAAWLAPGYWEERVHPDDVPEVRRRYDELKASDCAVELEFRMRRDDGSWAWIRSIAHGRRPGESALVSGFMMDITERRRMELELHQAQKLESVGRLAAGVAHEINTPVQFVSDSVHFLREASHELEGLLGELRELCRKVAEGRPAEELAAAAAAAQRSEAALDLEYLIENVPQAIDRSLEGLDRIATIVRSMKEFAHPDRTQMAAIDLNRAIENTLTIARNEYKYVAEIERDLGEIPLVTCHGGDVNQALLNIVVNAAHAIADVVGETRRKGRIGIRTRLEGEHVVITISDTGGGIPEGIRDRIFDQFFTTKAVGRGTGQGLAIARAVVVEKHGGKLSVETEVGQGTTFVVALPVHARLQEAA